MRTWLFVFALCATARAQTGKIIGRAVDGSGNAVAGAVITASLKPPIPPGTTITGGSLPVFMPVSANSLSGASGAFEIDNLTAGAYVVCMEKTAAALLNPCIWSDMQTIVTVSASGAANTTVTAVNGTVINIRVADPSGLLSAAPTKDDIMIGVAHGQAPFLPAQVISRDAGGKTVGVTVPAGQAIAINVYSAGFTLTDTTGTTSSSKSFTIPISAAQTVAAASAALPVIGSSTSPSSVTATITVIKAVAAQ
jgi:hypothetical protein